MPRVLAYLSDQALSRGAVLEVRRALSTHTVAFRNADLWKGEIERADFIFAPSYPGIERAYNAAGIQRVLSSGPLVERVQVQFPKGLEEVTIISAGIHRHETLSNWKPKGYVIALNRGVDCGIADVWLALDGFNHFDRPAEQPVQATILRYSSTIYAPKYIIIDDLWPHGVGAYTSTAAVTICKELKIKQVYLVGHDCELDESSQSRGWTPERLRGLDDQVRKAAQGLNIQRIRRDGRKDRTWP